MPQNDLRTPYSWKGEAVSPILLGTVQLGMPYGIANSHGQPSAAQACAIVETAWNAGIRHFDTAQAYGDSESILGQALRALGVSEEAQITSKFAATQDPEIIPGLEASLDNTLNRLGVNRLWCMMLHTPRWLPYWETGLGELLRNRRASGQIAHIGVSLGPPEDAPACLAHPDLEIIQAPCNGWDRRLISAGFFQDAAARDKLTYVRSVYLQGLLTMAPDSVQRRLPAAYPAAIRWHAVAARWGITPKAMALRFGISLGVPLVVGADTPEQLRETLQIAQEGGLPPECLSTFAEEFDALLSPEILEPWRWPQ